MNLESLTEDDLKLYSDDTIQSLWAKHRSVFGDAELARMYGEEIRRRKSARHNPRRNAPREAA